MPSKDFRIRIKVDAADAKRDVTNFSSALDGLGIKAGVVSGALVAVAAAAGTVAVAMSKAVRSAVEFESGLIGVGKTTDLAGAQLKELGDEILDLSTRIPVATGELLAIAQSAGQLGVTGSDNILRFTSTVAKLGTASDLSGEQAATALARILNVSGEAVSGVGTLASVIVSLGNNFAATESEIARHTGEVARATSVYELGSAQAAAYGTTLAAFGVRAELAGSAMGRTFRTIEEGVKTGGPLLEQLSDIAGVAGDDLRRAFGESPVQAMDLFLSGLRDIQESGGNVAKTLDDLGLGGEEIAKVIPVLAKEIDTLREAQELANQETENANALNEEFARFVESAAAQIELLRNRLQRIGVEVGSELLPALTDLVGLLGEIAEDPQAMRQLRETASAMGEAASSAVELLDALRPVIDVALKVLGDRLKVVGVLFDAARKQVEPLTAVINALGGDSETAADGLESVDDQLSKLSPKLLDFETSASRAGDSAGEASSSVADLAERLKELDEAIKAAQGRIEDHRENIEEIREEYRSFNELLERTRDLFNEVLAERNAGDIPMPELTSEDVTFIDWDELEADHEEHIENLREEFEKNYAQRQQAVMERAWGNIQDIATDAIATIIKDGEVDFGKLADSILDIFANMLAELLVMWAINAAKRAALEQGVAAASGGGGGGGSLSSLLGGGGGGGGLNMTAAGWVQVIGTAALIGAAVFLAGKVLEKMNEEDFQTVGSVSITGGQSASRSISLSGSAMVNAVLDFVDQFEEATGGLVQSLPELSFKMKEGSDEVAVLLQGSLIGLFDSAAEAIDFGLRSALQIADISGLGEEFASALESGMFRSLDHILEIANILKIANDATLSDTTLKIREMLDHFDQLRQKLEEVGISAEALGPAMARGWQSIRDSITGTTRSARELFEERRQAFNEELRMERRKQERLLATAEAEIAVAEAEVARLETLLAGINIVGDVIAEMVARWQEQLDIAQQQLAEAERQRDSARTALDNLPDPIGPGEFRDRQVGSDRDRLRDMLRQSEISSMDDFDAALARINDRWDEARELAHGNADLLNRVAEAREREIRALRQQAVDDVYGRLTDFERDPNLSPFREAMRSVANEADSLREDFLALAEDLGFGAERIEIGLSRIAAAERRRLEALAGQEAQDLLLSALDFLGRSEEAERIRFELQKAELQIRYEELRIAVERFELEASLLEGLAGIMEEVADFTFEDFNQRGQSRRRFSRSTNRAADAAERLADRLEAAKRGISDFLGELSLNRFGGLSPREALANAEGRFDAILAEARTGNISALEQFPEVGRDFLRIAREVYASSPEFRDIFERVQNAGIDLLGVSRAREGNVVFDERFYRGQQQTNVHLERIERLMEENNRLRQQQQARSSRVA